MADKFDPNDFDWFCDKCGSYLNAQSGWTGKAGTYVCKRCGYSNPIRKFNTFDRLIPGVEYTDPMLPGREKYDD